MRLDFSICIVNLGKPRETIKSSLRTRQLDSRHVLQKFVHTSKISLAIYKILK